MSVALKLAENGVKVAINYRQNEAAANDTVMKVRERGSEGRTGASRDGNQRRSGKFTGQVESSSWKIRI
jgi:NAD(P)-dependent dehydrogenase (short-subunit alcohol dehydrogenase family)